MKKLIAVFSVMSVLLAVVLMMGAYSSIGPYAVTGPLPTQAPTGYATFGSNALTFTGTGTSTLCLSGTSSVPCSQLWLQPTGGSCLVGSTTAAGTFSLAASATLNLPVTNVNMVFVTVTSATKCNYLYVK